MLTYSSEFTPLHYHITHDILVDNAHLGFHDIGELLAHYLTCALAFKSNYFNSAHSEGGALSAILWNSKSSSYFHVSQSYEALTMIVIEPSKKEEM